MPYLYSSQRSAEYGRHIAGPSYCSEMVPDNFRSKESTLKKASTAISSTQILESLRMMLWLLTDLGGLDNDHEVRIYRFDPQVCRGPPKSKCT